MTVGVPRPVAHPMAALADILDVVPVPVIGPDLYDEAGSIENSQRPLGMLPGEAARLPDRVEIEISVAVQCIDPATADIVEDLVGERRPLLPIHTGKERHT